MSCCSSSVYDSGFPKMHQSKVRSVGGWAGPAVVFCELGKGPARRLGGVKFGCMRKQYGFCLGSFVLVSHEIVRRYYGNQLPTVSIDIDVDD